MPRPTKATPAGGQKTNAKKFVTQQSVDLAIKSICDIMRRGNVASALQYVPELTWILFLRILDETEDREEQEADAVGASYTSSLKKPYRWKDWAAPLESAKTKPNKRKELEESSTNAFKKFVNDELIPYLKRLKDKHERDPAPEGDLRDHVGRREDTDRHREEPARRGRQDARDHERGHRPYAHLRAQPDLRGPAAEDGREGFRRRPVLHAARSHPCHGPRHRSEDWRNSVRPLCGTGGFLAQAAEYMQPKIGAKISGPAIARFRQETFWGREKENLIYPIGLANLILHGMDRPNIWHGNALTGDEVYGGLFAGAPTQFDVVLTNPPFGGKESPAAQTNFDYRTSATQVLFLRHIIRALKADGGRGGMVIDEGVLFRTNEDAFVKTKRKLTDECDLWCILSLPGGVFSTAGAGVKTNLLFFTKGKSTEKIWYYDLSDVKVGKKTPLTLKHFEDFAAKLATREDSERSWTVDLSARRAKAAADAQPFKDTARGKSQEADRIKDQLADLKKAKLRDEPAIADAEMGIVGLLKEAREATNKADGIESAVYDLKAVNPNRKADVDRRTPAELLDLIEVKGREVAEALATLRVLTEIR